MRTPDCKSFDFAYETYEGEKKIYCAKRGGNVRQGECSKCRDKEAKNEAAA